MYLVSLCHTETIQLVTGRCVFVEGGSGTGGIFSNQRVINIRLLITICILPMQKDDKFYSTTFPVMVSESKIVSPIYQ